MTIFDSFDNFDHNDKYNPIDLWHDRHWLHFWQLRTWIHDNLCYLTIKSNTGQLHSQFLRCLFLFEGSTYKTYILLKMNLYICCFIMFKSFLVNPKLVLTHPCSRALPSPGRRRRLHNVHCTFFHVIACTGFCTAHSSTLVLALAFALQNLHGPVGTAHISHLHWNQYSTPLCFANCLILQTQFIALLDVGNTVRHATSWQW